MRRQHRLGFLDALPELVGREPAVPIVVGEKGEVAELSEHQAVAFGSEHVGLKLRTERRRDEVHDIVEAVPGEAAGPREIDDPAEQPVAVPRQLLLEQLPGRRHVALLVPPEQVLLVQDHPQVPHAGGHHVLGVLV